MSFIKLLCTMALFLISTLVFAQDAKELEYEGFKYLEETIIAEVPYATGLVQHPFCKFGENEFAICGRPER